MAKEKFQFWIDTSLLERLKKICKKTGAPISEIIRRAIDNYTKGAGS